MKKENTKVGFTLKGIKTEQFAIFEENYVPKKETGLGSELQFKLDQTNKLIAVFLGFENISQNSSQLSFQDRRSFLEYIY